MDIQQIATAAMALLSPCLAKVGEGFFKKIGEGINIKVTNLYQAVKEKFAGDDYAEQTLARVEGNPTSSGRQAILKEVLVEKMEDDANFADMIRRLVEETHNEPSGDKIIQMLSISGKAGDVIQVAKVEGHHNNLGDRSLSNIERGNN